MAASIESRVPFLDHKLVEFAAAMPDGVEALAASPRSASCARRCKTCSARRSSAPQDGVPRAVRDLGARTLARSRPRCAARSPRARAGAVRPGRSRGCWTITRRAAPTAASIWSLLNLELWYRTWIDGDGVQSSRRPVAAARPRRAPTGAALQGRSSMKILWLNPDLLLPLDKGGKLRTWHLMRHLARRHHITYLSFADPDAPEADRAGMSEVCAESKRFRDAIRGRAALSFCRRGRATSCAAAVRRGASTALRISRPASRTCSRPAASTSWSAISWHPSPTCPHASPVHPCSSRTTWRLKSGGVTRRRRDRPCGRHCCRTQWRRTVRLEGDAVRRFDLVLAVSDTDRAHAAQAVRPAAPGRARRADGRGDGVSSRTSPGRCALGTWSSRDRWTGCPTRTGCSISSAKCCRSSGARNRTPRSPSSGARRRRRSCSLAPSTASR